MKRSISNVILITLVLFSLFTHHAEAYLDPNTGSYLLQIMAAALFGGIFFAKSWWGHAKRIVQNIFSRKDKKTSEKHSHKEK